MGSVYPIFYPIVQAAKNLLLLGILLFASTLQADTLNCQDLYVGRVEISEGQGLSGVVFINTPDSSSGSYWVRFSGWSESDKQSALSLLMAAKLSQHRVNLRTKETSGCDIQAKPTVASRLRLATNQFSN